MRICHSYPRPKLVFPYWKHQFFSNRDYMLKVFCKFVVILLCVAIMDGQLLCKLKNKSYSMHNLSVGDHPINVVSGGLSNGKKSLPLKITVAENQSNYMSVFSTESRYINKITAQEFLRIS